MATSTIPFGQFAEDAFEVYKEAIGAKRIADHSVKVLRRITESGSTMTAVQDELCQKYGGDSYRQKIIPILAAYELYSMTNLEVATLEFKPSAELVDEDAIGSKKLLEENVMLRVNKEKEHLNEPRKLSEPKSNAGGFRTPELPPVPIAPQKMPTDSPSNKVEGRSTRVESVKVESVNTGGHESSRAGTEIWSVDDMEMEMMSARGPNPKVPKVKASGVETDVADIPATPRSVKTDHHSLNGLDMNPADGALIGNEFMGKKDVQKLEKKKEEDAVKVSKLFIVGRLLLMIVIPFAISGIFLFQLITRIERQKVDDTAMVTMVDFMTGMNRFATNLQRERTISAYAIADTTFNTVTPPLVTASHGSPSLNVLKGLTDDASTALTSLWNQYPDYNDANAVPCKELLTSLGGLRTQVTDPSTGTADVVQSMTTGIDSCFDYLYRLSDHTSDGKSAQSITILIYLLKSREAMAQLQANTSVAISMGKFDQNALTYLSAGVATVTTFADVYQGMGMGQLRTFMSSNASVHTMNLIEDVIAQGVVTAPNTTLGYNVLNQMEEYLESMDQTIVSIITSLPTSDADTGLQAWTYALMALCFLIPVLCGFITWFITHPFTSLEKAATTLMAGKKDLQAYTDACEKFVPFQVLKMLPCNSPADVDVGLTSQIKMTIMVAGMEDFMQVLQDVGHRKIPTFIGNLMEEVIGRMRKHAGLVANLTQDTLIVYYHNQEDAVKTAADLVYWQRTTQSTPGSHFEMGLNLGEVLFGVTGTHSQLIPSTSSDDVMVAHGAKGQCKVYKTPVLLTLSAKNFAKNSIYTFRSLGSAVLPGRVESVDLYEALDVLHPEQLRLRKGTYAFFQKGVEAHRDRRYKDGVRLMNEVLDSNPDDGPARHLLKRMSAHVEEEG